MELLHIIGSVLCVVFVGAATYISALKWARYNRRINIQSADIDRVVAFVTDRTMDLPSPQREKAIEELPERVRKALRAQEEKPMKLGPLYPEELEEEQVQRGSHTGEIEAPRPIPPPPPPKQRPDDKAQEQQDENTSMIDIMQDLWAAYYPSKKDKVQQARKSLQGALTEVDEVLQRVLQFAAKRFSVSLEDLEIDFDEWPFEVGFRVTHNNFRDIPQSYWVTWEDIFPPLKEEAETEKKEVTATSSEVEGWKHTDRFEVVHGSVLQNTLLHSPLVPGAIRVKAGTTVVASGDGGFCNNHGWVTLYPGIKGIADSHPCIHAVGHLNVTNGEFSLHVEDPKVDYVEISYYAVRSKDAKPSDEKEEQKAVVPSALVECRDRFTYIPDKRSLPRFRANLSHFPVIGPATVSCRLDKATVRQDGVFLDGPGGFGELKFDTSGKGSVEVSFTDLEEGEQFEVTYFTRAPSKDTSREGCRRRHPSYRALPKFYDSRTDKFKCPRCKKYEFDCDSDRHGETQVCPKCELRFTKRGAVFELSDVALERRLLKKMR